MHCRFLLGATLLGGEGYLFGLLDPTSERRIKDTKCLAPSSIILLKAFVNCKPTIHHQVHAIDQAHSGCA